MKISKDVSNMLKGIAAFGVLINHIYNLWGTDTFISVEILKEIIGRWSDLGMFIFLFISGYGLYSSYLNSGLDNYWEKKVKNIYIPMLCANCLAVVIYQINLKRLPSREACFRGIVSDGSEYNGLMWYIEYLFVWYFLFWIIHKVVKSEKKAIIAWCIIAGIMLYLTPETYGLANEYCLAFPLGVIFNIRLRNIEIMRGARIPMKGAMYILCSFLAGVISVLWFRDFDYSIYDIVVNFFIYTILINFVLAVLMSGIIYILEMIEGKKISKVFLLMGDYSFAI